MECISCKQTPEAHTAFDVAASANRFRDLLDKLFKHEVSRWIPPYIQTAVCDAVYHELKRVADAVAGCKGCSDKVEQIIKDASQQRYKSTIPFSGGQ